MTRHGSGGVVAVSKSPLAEFTHQPYNPVGLIPTLKGAEMSPEEPLEPVVWDARYTLGHKILL